MEARQEAGPPSVLEGLCNFCRPRMLDLSRLGWKEKKDSKGDTFLEPSTITLPNGDIVLESFEDEGVFGPCTDFFAKLYSPHGTDPPFKGIEISGMRIRIEYYRCDQLPHCPQLADTAAAGCQFYKALTELVGKNQECMSRYWGQFVTFLSLEYCFEWRVVDEDGLMSANGEQRLELQSLTIEYQPRISIKKLKILIASVSSL